MTDQITIAETLRKFTTAKWLQWTEDILGNGPAFPIRHFDPDDSPEDVLTQMVAFLQKQGISRSPFEKAVKQLLLQYQKKDFNAEKLDALLNVCLQSRSIICKPTVIQILLEGQLDGLTHDGYSLSGTAIQALGATDLTAVEYDTIKRFILHTPRQSLSAGTLTQSLYFFRKHYDPKEPLGDYFRFIDIALSELQDRQKEDAFTNAIMFELYGAAFYRTQDFFYHFFKWYKNNDMDHWAGEITWLFFQWAQNDPEVGPDFNRTMFEAYMKVEGLTNVEIEKSDIYVSYNTRTLEFKNLQKKLNTFERIQDERVFEMLVNYIDTMPESKAHTAADVMNYNNELIAAEA